MSDHGQWNDWDVPSSAPASQSGGGQDNLFSPLTGQGESGPVSVAPASREKSDDWFLPDSARGDDSSGMNTAGGQPPQGRGHSHSSKVIWIAASAIIALVTGILIWIFSSSTPLGGDILVTQTAQPGGLVRVRFSYTLNWLDPDTTYVAGFTMARKGEELSLIGVPANLRGKATQTVTTDIWLSEDGEYQCGFFYYPLSGARASEHAPQTFYVSLDKVSLTATPIPTPAPTPTSTPRLTPSPSPYVTPSPSPTAKATTVPTPVVSTVLPASPLFKLYDASTRYYYFQLSDTEKELFAELYDAIADSQEKITVSKQNYYTVLQLKHVINVIRYDCPELFHVEGSFSYTYQSDSAPLIISVSITYTMDKAQYESELEAIKTRIAALSSLLPPISDEYGRELTIYRHILDISHYDMNLPYCANANSVWIYGYSKCSGYAQALSLALRWYGIHCASIIGDGNGSRHQWSIVRINSQWYQCDVTWDDPIIAGNQSSHYASASEKPLLYLNLTDAEMALDHTLDQIEDFTLPACTSTQDNYIFRESVSVSAGMNDITSYVNQYLQQAYNAGKDFLLLRFDSAADCSRYANRINGSYVKQYSQPRDTLLVLWFK